MRKRVAVVPETKFKKDPELVTAEGHIVSQGDLIKIKGEYGSQFKFFSLTTNIETGASWIDCFEIFRGSTGQLRAFSIDKLKRIPKKRVKKNVN